MNTKVIVMADFRKRVSHHYADTLNRHKEYISEFRKIPDYEKTQLIVIHPSLQFNNSSFSTVGNVVLIQKSVIELLNLKKFFTYLRYETDLIVAGDPSESFLFAKFLKLILGDKSIPVQVQIHGEYSENWARLSLRNRIRRLIAKVLLKSADAVRVVSKEQQKYIVETFSVDPKKIISVPVRLNYTGYGEQFPRENNPSSIGFVGRIHRERNISKFVAICKYFCEINPKLEVIVVGGFSGDRKAEKLLRNLGLPNLKILGHLEGADLNNAWSRIGILISTAETESYGRSMREALIHGVPVLAVSSVGSRELQKECPEAVKLFDSKDSESKIYQEFIRLLVTKVPHEYRERQELRDSMVSTQIALTWKDAMENIHIG